MGRQFYSALAVFTFIVFGSLSPVEAVTLQWDSNHESDLAGYTIYYGTASHQYGSSVDVGNHTSYQFTNLEAGRTFFFALRAYNTSGLQSDLSAEVSATIPVVPLSLTNLMANLSSPRVLGTSVIFAAAASGGVPPYQYKFLVSDGTVTTVARNWSTGNTFTWQPSAAKSTYTITAWARNSTSTADAAENTASVRTMPFVITASASQITLTSMTASPLSPQTLGTPVAFTATAAGGSSSYQYKWLISDGTTTSVGQAWSSTSTFSWNPAAAGSNYTVTVWVRAANSAADAPDSDAAIGNIAFTIVRAASSGSTGSSSSVPGALSVTSLTSSLDSPQEPGTAITFAAVAAGGAAPYQFRWLVSDGTTWKVMQNWSGGTTFTWRPQVMNTNYSVRVQARNAGSSTNGADNPNADRSLPFAITSEQVMAVNLSSDKDEPQPVGTSIQFTASAYGGTSAYEYQWSLFTGTGWVVLQDWSGNASYTWTPVTASSKYRIKLSVRGGKNLAANAGVTMNFAIE
jgi:hypothetical protein